MTGQKDILLALADRAEKARGPDRELDGLIFDTTPIGELWRKAVAPVVGYPGDLPAYTASIDAAMKLVPKGHDFCLSQGWEEPAIAKVERSDRVDGIECSGETAALALCAAALRARSEG
jgi:hypothetical protein